MWPLELVATATDSPRYSPGGSFKKFPAVVNGISGTFSIVALRCANTGIAARAARVNDQVKICFIESPRTIQSNVHSRTNRERRGFGEPTPFNSGMLAVMLRT